MEFSGYILFTLVGVCLGLIGSGGSILTVPVLVYIYSFSPLMATSYSLFIVGITSSTGAVINYIRGYTRISLALPLGIISPLTVFSVRRYVLPYLPEDLWRIGEYRVTKSLLIMLLFALLMFASAVSMLKKGTVTRTTSATGSRKEYLALGLFGIGIGCVTGFLGSGGGFLIVPALVILLKVPMKEAIGTSLLIIAVNSLVGFAGDIGHYEFDWKFLFVVTSLSVAGIFLGNRLAKNIAPEKLKTAFGWFVLIMGLYIIIKEVSV
ncbi:MAG: sulfite exporter TauE/SafE family protein [Chitinophagaceae bacterium]|nr:sulfite exporter TauE/SafE family protein [Chitinophagaceae bacterium]MCW5927591.1 sulfite exporter TauE/SafE family protein [Chitinophagaceae bacterium]